MGLLIGLNGVQSGTSLTGMRGATAGTDMISVGVTGDTGDRFVINADGKLEWDAGDGGSPDTSIARSAAGVLDLASTALIFNTTQWAGARLTVGVALATGNDTLVVRQGAGQTGALINTINSAGNGGFFTVAGDGSVILAGAALATGATFGFVYMPSCAGTPSGTPVAHTGTVPTVVDTTGSKLWAYIGGAWKSVTLT